jgi:hypothetical protein
MNSSITYYAVKPITGGTATAVLRFYDNQGKIPERYTHDTGWIEDQELFLELASGNLGPTDIISESDAQEVINQINRKA